MACYEKLKAMSSRLLGRTPDSFLRVPYFEPIVGRFCLGRFLFYQVIMLAGVWFSMSERSDQSPTTITNLHGVTKV